MSEEKRTNRTVYKNDYQKKTATKFSIIFRNEKDSEVIEKMKSVPNKSDYIRQLILADIQKTKENQNL